MSADTERDEEVWRLPDTAQGEDVRMGGRSKSPFLSPAAKARLARIARGTPEVMVKITGRSRGIVHLKQHLDYITRNGRLEAELQDGTKVETRADLRALHEDWLAANLLGERRPAREGAAQSVGIILSMPAGTPPDRVHDAVRSWTRATLGSYDWLLVRHDDRDHPHVHLTVRAVGPNGRRLAVGPADLQLWREGFARELRRLGVEAEATPRKARGIVRKSEVAAVHRITERGAEAVIVRRRRDEAQWAMASDRDGPHAPVKWERAIQDRQSGIRAAYLKQAELLASSQDSSDQLLGTNLKRFVEAMPVPLTRQQDLALELRAMRPELGEHSLGQSALEPIRESPFLRYCSISPKR